MTEDAVQITLELPVGYGPELVIRLFPDYSAQHPLWFDFGYPDLSDLQLPDDLADRLHRWSAYWDSTFHWDHGWSAGAPDPWWTEEEDLLPRDVAIAFGSDFVIEAGDLYLHSTTIAAAPATAAAMHALVAAEADERARIRADITSGVRYEVVAGDTSYTEWLAAPQRDEPPNP